MFLFDGCDPRDDNARERGDGIRDRKEDWLTLGRGPGSAARHDDHADHDTRGRDTDWREERESRERDHDCGGHDPRDVFLHGLDLPRGLERELVQDERERTYEINREDSRMLATVGAFRVVSERDLRDPRKESEPRESDLRHLRDEGLVRFVSLDGRERAVTLTERGRHLLEAHRRERDDEGQQTFLLRCEPAARAQTRCGALHRLPT